MQTHVHVSHPAITFTASAKIKQLLTKSQGTRNIGREKEKAGSLRHLRLIELRWVEEEEGWIRKKRTGHIIGLALRCSFLAVSREGNSSCPDPLNPTAWQNTAPHRAVLQWAIQEKTHGLYFSTAGVSNLTAMSVNHISTPILHTAWKRAYSSLADFILNFITETQNKAWITDFKHYI